VLENPEDASLPLIIVVVTNCVVTVGMATPPLAAFGAGTYVFPELPAEPEVAEEAHPAVISRQAIIRTITAGGISFFISISLIPVFLIWAKVGYYI
jgi:hypothetical protein